MFRRMITSARMIRSWRSWLRELEGEIYYNRGFIVSLKMFKMEVDDNGEKMEFLDKEDLKIIFPEEFKILIGVNGKF